MQLGLVTGGPQPWWSDRADRPGCRETRVRSDCLRHIVIRMVSLEELQAQVVEGYGRLGMPSWPDPHPGMALPREEEYSRVTEPERYRIVHTRARLWADKLVGVPGVKAEALAPAPLDEEGHLGLFDRGVRLTSVRPSTLPLLLLERDARLPGGDKTLAVLHVSVFAPAFALEMLPDCGCDACDGGSADLLRAIDETIGHVVGGPFVLLRGKGWNAQWHPEGGSSGGTRRGVNHAQAMELCRRLAVGEGVRLPRGVAAFVGRSWLD